MELYSIVASWAGWPVIVAFLLLASLYAYFILQNRIDLLKEENDRLERRVDELREYSPDILAQRLSERSRKLSEELEKLSADHEASQKLIKSKEAELIEVKAQITNLKSQIEKAQEFLRVVSDSKLLCPQCGEPLEIRDVHYELVEHDGRELDIDHENVAYACGLEIVDGKIISECRRSRSAEQKAAN